MTESPGTDTSTTTILFTDLVGSTELLDSLGDEAGHELHQQHLTLLRRAIADYGGREVKAMGDGLMVAFSSAISAVRCAIAMQEAVSADPDAGRLRIGIDSGEPILLNEDLFGTPVVVAKRLCDLATGGQILASDLVRRLIGRRLSARFMPLGEISVKGLSAPLEAVEIDWLNADAGVSPRAPSAERGPAGPFPGRGGSSLRATRRAPIPVLAGALVIAAVVTGLILSLSSGGGAETPSRADGSVQVFRPAGRQASAEHPCYGPPGRDLLFTLFTNGYNNPTQVGTASLDALGAGGGGTREVITHVGNAAVNAAGGCYTRAARRLVYSSDVGSTDNIWTALTGGVNDAEHQVTCYRSQTIHATEPSWSPDGKFLVFALRDDRAPGQTTIWRVPANNDCARPHPPARIVPGPAGCPRLPLADNHEPNWSPGGNRIVFQRQVNAPGGPINLWSVQPDGCGLTRITSTSDADTDPSWSPDGTRIVYSTDHAAPTGVPNLFIVPATGGTPVRLTGQCFYDGFPSWSPDGRWISFETWPLASPAGGDAPTAIWRIAATARPRAPLC